MYWKYIPVPGDDLCYDLSVRNSTAYLTGRTGSDNFPTENPYQPVHAGGDDTFISRLASSGSILLFSTYYGGDGDDRGYAISIENGEAYLTGSTYSDDLPTENPYQPGRSAGEDVFIGKLNSSGSLLLYSTYLGGSGTYDKGRDISVENGEATVGGYTRSSDFPVLNSYQSSKGGMYAAFITRVATAGSSLIYSTYLGGSEIDRVYGVAVRDGAVYVSGRTGSPDFPTKNPYQAGFSGDYNPFVSKLIFYTPTPTPIGYKTPKPTPTAQPTPSVTPSPTLTLTPTITPSSTPTPSITPSPTLTPYGYKTPSPTPSSGPAIYVPDDYATIQDAINAATSTNMIIVRDGTYTGEGNRDIDFLGKAVTLLSENGPENTIINCSGSGRRGFYFHSGETSSSILDGFTITGGGVSQENGGGLYINDSSPTIRNCIITGNNISGGSYPGYGGSVSGGGIYLYNSSSLITCCMISNNSATGYDASSSGTIDGESGGGGGISCSGGLVTISYCTISGNSAHGGNGGCFGGRGGGGGAGGVSGPAVISHSIISGNQATGGDGKHGADASGGGISGADEVINCLIRNNSVSGGSNCCCPSGSDGAGTGAGISGSAVIKNCLIYNNTASSYGGGSSGSPTITNSILWYNAPDQINGGSTTINYSDIEGGWAGTWNIDTDPQFTSSTDFHLTGSSPCIDTGDNFVVTWGNDLDDHTRIWDGKGGGTAIVDMGVYEYAAPLITATPTPIPSPTSTPTPYGYKTPTPTSTPTPKICMRLEEGFDDFQYGARPAGWIFSGCNANTDVYTATGYYGLQAPSIRLDQDGDAIETATFGTPDDLAFWVRGISYLEYDSLLVEEYYSSWTTITDLDLSPWSSQGEIIGPFDLKITTRKIKFSYSSTGGEMAIDDITIHCAFTPTPTPHGYKTPTPVPTSSSSPSPSIPLPTATSPPTATPSPFPTPICLVIAGNDYDGDGIADMAVWNTAHGRWMINLSGGGSPSIFYFGTAGDHPIPGDYDGDGFTDAGIFRTSSGLWAIRGVSRIYFGASGDIPIPGDYDGDGTVDPGVFRQSSGLWAIRGISRLYFGGSDDLPIPGDYGGDGTDRIGIFRPSTGLWAVPGITRRYFGRGGDYPVPADYRGVGDEIGIFRPASGLWAIRAVSRLYFGTGGDVPQPADFSGNGLPLINIYRSTTGLWAIRGHTRAYWGGPSYIPVTR